MRTDSIYLKLLACTFFLPLFVDLAWGQQTPPSDETSQREVESRKLLQRMKEAPPAPMPSAAAVRPDAESSSPESRSLESYDQRTGKLTKQAAGDPSAQATSVNSQKPERLKNADGENDQTRKCKKTTAEDVDGRDYDH